MGPPIWNLLTPTVIFGSVLEQFFDINHVRVHLEVQLDLDCLSSMHVGFFIQVALDVQQLSYHSFPCRMIGQARKFLMLGDMREIDHLLYSFTRFLFQ